MNKWTSALFGIAAGAVTSVVFLYLFAPARGTTFDKHYQSRLDWALAEGKKAGIERERALFQELEDARTSSASSTANPYAVPNATTGPNARSSSTGSATPPTSTSSET